MACTALVMVIIKILLECVIFVINQINHQEKEKQISEGVTCIYYYEKEKKGKCSNILFKKNIKEGCCPCEECHGFNTGKLTVSNEMIFVSNPWLLILKKVIDFFPEFAAVLLALNELIVK